MITGMSIVSVWVLDQDSAKEFYTKKLGFTLTADTPYGDGERWVEVVPPGGGTALALTPGRGEFTPGRMTGITLSSPDVRGVHAELQDSGVDVDGELMGGDGTVPLMFFLRDGDGNQLLIVADPQA